MFRRSFLVGVTTLLACGAAAASPHAHERSRIDKLISFVESQKGMKFIRNGTEYECVDAAKFLRGKLESMGKEVTTAREFIERIASKSSMSGKPYHVKFADGRTMLASQFLGDELKRIEGQPA
ncbi:MAG: DUF5329 family protein [Rhizobiales bacterium]|nr:DUF5329 family protein [Rhizobacter sp.]